MMVCAGTWGGGRAVEVGERGRRGGGRACPRRARARARTGGAAGGRTRLLAVLEAQQLQDVLDGLGVRTGEVREAVPGRVDRRVAADELEGLAHGQLRQVLVDLIHVLTERAEVDAARGRLGRGHARVRDLALDLALGQRLRKRLEEGGLAVAGRRQHERERARADDAADVVEDHKVARGRRARRAERQQAARQRQRHVRDGAEDARQLVARLLLRLQLDRVAQARVAQLDERQRRACGLRGRAGRRRRGRGRGRRAGRRRRRGRGRGGAQRQRRRARGGGRLRHSRSGLPPQVKREWKN